jgi:hypothetical protein
MSCSTISPWTATFGTAFAASEAFKALAHRIDVKTWRFLPVKWTEATPLLADFLERDVAAHQIDDIDALANAFDNGLGNLRHQCTCKVSAGRPASRANGLGRVERP